MPFDLKILGSGVYTPREAARLVGTKPVDVLRWTRGSGPTAPLWHAYYSELDDGCEVNFADLMELRIVSALRRVGVSLQAIRFAIQFAKDRFKIDRPLSSSNFKVDGNEILLNAIEKDGELVSLSKRHPGQKVFRKIIEQSLRDIEYEGDRPIRWHPQKTSYVVVDPVRFFGAPILDEFGVSTKVLADEYDVFGDPRYLSKIYEIPLKQIKDGINFERRLDDQSPI